MDILIVPLLSVIYTVLSMSSWIIVVHIFVSWLIIFGILNIQNSFVYSIVSFLSRFSEIFARPIRNILPPFGNIDLSLFIALLIIYFVQGVITRLLLRFSFS